MLKDLMHSYLQGDFRSSDYLIAGSHHPKPGLYIRLYLDQSWPEQAAQFNDNHLLILPKEEQQPALHERYTWFQTQDYYSSLVTMNKAVDKGKQIHSSHPFALFAKREVFLGEKAGMKHSMPDNIARFLELIRPEQIRQRWMELIAPKKSDKLREGKIMPESFFSGMEFAEALAYLDSAWRRDSIHNIQQWYAENLQSLTDHVSKLSFKNYIKLFFTYSTQSPSIEPYTIEQAFLYEYYLYTLPKIFNSNEYNQLLDDEIYGLPGFNMNMNSKKPFLEHKSMSVRIPTRISLREAMQMKQVSEWLLSRPKYAMNRFRYESDFQLKKTLNPEGVYHIYVDGRDNEVYSYENLPFSTEDAVHIRIRNVMELTDRFGNLKVYEPIRTISQLQKEVSKHFFRGRMNQEQGGFLEGDGPKPRPKDFTSGMAAVFMQSRQAFHDWFFKGTEITVRPLFGKLTLRLIEEQLLYVEPAAQKPGKGGALNLRWLSQAFNVRLSLEAYLRHEEGGPSMPDMIDEVRKALKERLTLTDTQICATDEEFYYLAGQVAFYLKSQSEAQLKTGDLLGPLLSAKRSELLKRRLDEAYNLHKHKIYLNHYRFNRAFASLCGYKPECEPDGKMREMFLAGLFSDNWFYEKKAEVKGTDQDNMGQSGDQGVNSNDEDE